MFCRAMQGSYRFWQNTKWHFSLHNSMYHLAGLIKLEIKACNIIDKTNIKQLLYTAIFTLTIQALKLHPTGPKTRKLHLTT